MKHQFLIAGIMLFFANSLSGWAQDGKTLFQNNCTACHSIGQGRMAGPDLKDVSNRRDKTWVTKFIKNSSDLTNGSDATAVALVKEYGGMTMPPFDLKADEIDAIITYINATSTGGAATEQVAEVPAKPATVADVLKGRQLFIGVLAFTNGGVSCLTCHAVNSLNMPVGGHLAKELTHSFKGLQSGGLKGMLSSPPFPAMKAAYQDKPLTDKEIFQLTAFLESASKSIGSKNSDIKKDNKLFIYGLVGCVLFVLLLIVVWQFRKKD